MEIFPLQYSLILEDGDSWSLYFSSELIPWGKKLAQILGLTEDTKSQRYKIFFSTDGEANAKKKKYSPFFDKYFRPYYESSISLLELEIRDHPAINTYLCLLPELNDNDVRKSYLFMILSLFPLYHGTIKSGGIILHAALLHHPDIGGIAILAPGGTGKSTCAKRIPSPWLPYSDDLILVPRPISSLFNAHPLPTWSLCLSDCSPAPIWRVERYTRLRGLFFLQQSDSDVIIQLPKIDSVKWIYQSSMEACQWFIENMTKENQMAQKTVIFSNACNLAQSCPSFILKASYNGYFWEEIEKVFLGDNHKN